MRPSKKRGAARAAPRPRDDPDALPRVAAAGPCGKPQPLKAGNPNHIHKGWAPVRHVLFFRVKELILTWHMYLRGCFRYLNLPKTWLNWVALFQPFKRVMVYPGDLHKTPRNLWDPWNPSIFYHLFSTHLFSTKLTDQKDTCAYKSTPKSWFFPLTTYSNLALWKVWVF